MATFMEKVGCTYDTASNGLMALEKYISSTQSHQYDFVLMGSSTTSPHPPFPSFLTFTYFTHN